VKVPRSRDALILNLGECRRNHVVVDIGQGHVHRVEPVVGGVEAGRGAQQDEGKLTSPSAKESFTPRDCDRLRHVPVGGGERQRRDADEALAWVAGADGDGDVGRGLNGERDG